MKAITVGELKALLDDYGDHVPVYVNIVNPVNDVTHVAKVLDVGTVDVSTEDETVVMLETLYVEI